MSETLSLPGTVKAERRCPYDPPEAHRRLRDAGELGKLELPGGLVMWFLTKHDDIRAMLADSRFTGARVPFPAMSPEIPAGFFFSMDPPDHTRYRRTLTAEFSVRGARELTGRIERLADRHLDAMEAAGTSADLVAAYANPVPAMVISDILGVPYSYHQKFDHEVRTLRETGGDDQAVGAMATAWWEEMRGFVRAKRAEPGDDMISRLLHDEVEGGALTDEEVVGIAMTIIFAGHEPVENLIGLGMLALFQDREQLTRLRENPDLIDGAVEEFLRYFPVNNFGTVRTATEDAVINGHPIAKGEIVAGLVSTANRDPGRFDDPDRLVLDRAHTSHLAFGHGVHQCLGQQLARVELKVLLQRLLVRFPALRLAVAPEEIKYRENTSFYGVHELPVTWAAE
ncbi:MULTISPECIES: cytochrome P450 [Streptomyces violaceusniger group]|uniref:Cytochrome P450 n=2 Tax=Streptomyces javensis TaxID=114698 RepID=A0ABS0RDA2_9ACTN|nr:cytochrome P450 [Streptomyces javensis]MBI0315372.1 cytochrome P450 [Streptomyces javensis]